MMNQNILVVEINYSDIWIVPEEKHEELLIFLQSIGKRKAPMGKVTEKNITGGININEKVMKEALNREPRDKFPKEN